MVLCLKEFSIILIMIEVLPTSESPTMQVFNFLSISAIILLMLKPKVKLQQLTPLQKGEEISSIYRMISLQEKTLDDILTKYNGDGEEQLQIELRQRESRTLEARPHIYMLPNGKKQKQRYKIQSDSLQLPSIKARSVKHHSKKNSTKLDVLNPNPYLSQLSKKEESQKMKQIIEKAYLTEKAQKLRANKRKKSRQKSIKSELQKISSVSDSVPNQTNLQSQNLQQKRGEKQIPKPIGYIKSLQGEDQDSSSNEGQIAVSYYEREFRGLIRSQSLQETNFLYFSKNESMKDWTENLLLLFEKHDKELVLLRKKCKYLEKFDNSFFTFDIFKND